MPAQGNDTSSLVLGDNLLAHSIKRNPIEVLLAVQLYLAEVKPHHGWVIAGSEEHVTLSMIPFPSSTIHRIILMPQHNTLV